MIRTRLATSALQWNLVGLALPPVANYQWYTSKINACSVSAGFTTPRAILTGHDCEVTCASVCAELGLVISGCKGKH